MRQTLHLLVVDDGRCSALATFHAKTWLLPIVDLPERARAAAAVAGWLAARGLRGDLLGQWLGRLSQNGAAVDWLAVVSLSSQGVDFPPSDLRWTALSTLRSLSSMLAYQSWALAGVAPTGDGPPATAGPFGDTDWLDEARRFIRAANGRGHAEGAIVLHRVSAFELVLEYRAKDQRLFLKGLEAARVPEARLTMCMQERDPRRFAQTVAFETRPDGSAWWLADACPGEPLTERLTPATCAATGRAYARAQQMSSGSAAVLAILPVLDLEGLVAWTKGILEGSMALVQSEYCCGLLQEAFDRAQHPGMPLGWIAGDLDPSNVLVDGTDVRFIDLDDSIHGAVSAGMSILARRLRRCAPDCADAALDAYEQEWGPGLCSGDSRGSSDLMSILLECRLGWQRVLRKTERGEVHGLIEPVRAAVAARLARACLIRSPAI